MMMPPEVDYEVDLDDTPSGAAETESASIDAAGVRKLLKDSSEFFIEFFLPELEFEVPQLHKDVWQLLTNTALARVLLAIPRDHAKTTLSKLGVIWYWLFSPYRFAIYLSNTVSRAKDACRDIINFLKCDNFRQVYGDIEMEKESETDSIWIFNIPLGGGKYKRCILRAAGSNQSMRGINVDNQRPELAVIDDVEDEDNTASEHLQKKLDKWVFGTFLKALARRKKIIWLGNMLSKTSLLARLSERPNWNPVVFGCLIRNNATGAIESLWADRWPLDELIQDFKEYRDLGLVETWMCEMMNMPGHGENGFTSDQICYKPLPTSDGILAAWICIDPAFGLDQVNDDSSVTCHVLPIDGPPMVVGHITGKMTEAEMFDAAWQLGLFWGAWVWGIESVAAQRVLITLFRALAISKGLTNQIEFMPLISGTAKANRISSWVGQMAKEEYAIAEGLIEIVTQLLDYDMSKKHQRDDLIDSCAYGPLMLDLFEPLLIAQFNGTQVTQEVDAKFGRRVASV